MNRLDVYNSMRTEEKPEEKNSDVPLLFNELRKRLGGLLIEENDKKVFILRSKFNLRDSHGNICFSDLLKLDKGDYYEVLFNKELNKKNLSDSLLRKLAFFDIESTGLSGGAGTKAFLVGIITLENNEIVLTQYFLPNLSSEQLFLKNIKNTLFKGEKILISYNGKSYDINILRNRLVVNRLNANDLSMEIPHFDLLHSSRKIWKGKLPDYTLQRVERSILNFNREYDIPGYLIPDIFSRYLRGYNVINDLVKIFEHNKYDLLTLFGILIKQLRVIANSIEGKNQFEEQKHIDPASVSDLLIKKELKGEAFKLLDQFDNDPIAIKKKALLLKKETNYNDSVKMFEKLATKSRKAREKLFAYIEIAKIYEHYEKNLMKALEYTKRATDFLRTLSYLYPDYHIFQRTYKEPLTRRMLRLEKRINKLK